MRTLCLAMLVIGTFSSLACRNPTNAYVDQTWIHEWRIVNRTTETLEISIQTRHSGEARLTLQPDQEEIVSRYSWFLGPPPDPSRDLMCFSAYDGSGELVFHQNPVENAGWNRVDVREYESRMTRALTTQDLSFGGLPETCP